MVTMEQLLAVAREVNASDIHLTAGLPPRVRVNGELADLNYPKLMPNDVEKIVFSIMSEVQVGIYNNKGEADFAFSVPNIGRYRVNVFRQRGSVACAMRVVGTLVPKPEDLGIPQSVIDICSKKRGLVLVTGPTGSGKSTTLAALIDYINDTRNAHIITLEDPIEYLFSHRKSMINQREIGIDTHSYDLALKAALREDPDVIMVGELQDSETIATAITAAETGHLVFSTLHTIGAEAAIERIIDAFLPHQHQQICARLAMTLEAVVSQQLIPTADNKGRVAAFEVVNTAAQIKSLIRELKTYQIGTVIHGNKENGIESMDDVLIDMSLRGIITMEQAINYARDMTYVEKILEDKR
ncbi:MAG: type IV pilus twitching motility protein PilT [Eubacteriales bacterium]|nr:type IV pilus twitching motility protein PilT [Eubacteriales bacterium]